MNSLRFCIRILDDDNGIRLDGIDFRGIAFVDMYIDGRPFHTQPGLTDALIVQDELLRSRDDGGRFLVFTCACGVADDGGWGGVRIARDGDVVEWEFDTEEGGYRWVFASDEYKKALDSLASDLESLPSSLVLEPASVVFPENWT